MSTIRTIVVKCKLPFSPDFRNTVHEFSLAHQADFADVVAFRCNRCRQFIDVAPSSAAHTTCSNCYSDELTIIRLRLAFQDWGEQNGGTKARDERMEFAKTKAITQSGYAATSVGFSNSLSGKDRTSTTTG